jgi:hypothetical protein
MKKCIAGERISQISDDPGIPTFAFEEYYFEPRIFDITSRGIEPRKIMPPRRIPVILPIRWAKL